MSDDGRKRGEKLRQLVQTDAPLQIAGTLNAYCALLARDAGFQAIYLSGAGVANVSFGMADLGLTTRRDVVEDARRITAAVDLPLLVDADTGWEDEPGGVAATIKELCAVDVAGCHLEDQIPQKRCGHRDGKRLVDVDTACDRLKAAVDARTDSSFVIMARTDAYGVEGLNAAIDRANAYVAVGADMIFAESMKELDEYQAFCAAVSVPVLANMTEFGLTPLFNRTQLQQAGVGLALYPLSAFRAMSRAAAQVYQTLLRDGSQQAVLDQMQTRDELYDVLNYIEQEQQVDAALNADSPNSDNNARLEKPTGEAHA